MARRSVARRRTRRVSQSADLRAARLIDATARNLSVDRARDGFRHIADEDRLEACLGSCQRQYWQQACEGGETIEEAVTGPEQQRWADDDRIGPLPKIAVSPAALARA